MRPDTHFYQKQETLYVESIPVETLIREYGSPLYVYSAAAFREQAQHYLNAIDSRPGKVCFAVKACSNLFVLRTLASLGLGMDIVSGGELFRCQKAGIAGEHIVFSGVGKSAEEIQEALTYGIHSFNVESRAELHSIHHVAQNLNLKARISFRYNPDVDPQTHPYISTGLRDDKFGLPENELMDALSDLKDLPHLELSGLSIHIGSQILTLAPLKEAFEKLREMLDRVERLQQTRLSFLDLGGGVGVSYRKDENALNIQDYINSAYDIFGDRYTLYFEPGRSIAANSGALLTQVLYTKQSGTRHFVIVDTAMTDLIRPALYESYHEILAPPLPNQSLGPVDVVGPVCESGDFLALARELPRNIPNGTPLMILSAGAYGFSMSSNYNSRPRCAEVWVDGKNHTLIRARETYSDLIRGEKHI